MESAAASARDAVLAGVVGRRVASASSSLTLFSLALDDGRGLLAEASGDASAAAVTLSLLPLDALPQLAEAVCAVDWSWIVDATVRTATLADDQLHLELDPVGPLTVSAALWQGTPFLAFQPYRPPR